jgi:hypothetical protein
MQAKSGLSCNLRPNSANSFGKCVKSALLSFGKCVRVALFSFGKCDKLKPDEAKNDEKPSLKPQNSFRKV